MHRLIPMAISVALLGALLLSLGSHQGRAQVDGVALVPGMNLVAYQGPTTDVATGTASIADVMRSIWRFNNASQTWAVWADALPEALRGFSQLDPAGVYFVDVSADVFWTFGEATAARSLEFTFQHGADGWETAFADLPAAFDPDLYELDAGHRPLPSGLVGGGLFLQGHNRSDDLLMFATRQLAGLVPGQRYRVTFDLDLVTAVLGGGVGIGGAPGESVFVKAGAAAVAPAIGEDDLGMSRLNWDIGSQSSEGANAIVVGNVALPDGAATTGEGWGVKRLGLDGRAVEVVADDRGVVWLFVGTDSGFEGLTQVFLARVGVRLEPVPAP